MPARRSPAARERGVMGPPDQRSKASPRRGEYLDRRTVFGYFARWAKADELKKILDQLRRRIPLQSDRCPWPVRVTIDAQSVKGAETVSNATRGYDKRKDINGAWPSS